MEIDHELPSDKSMSSEDAMPSPNRNEESNKADYTDPKSYKVYRGWYRPLYTDINSLDEYMNVLARCRSVPALPPLLGKKITECAKWTMQKGGILDKRRFDKSLDHTTVVVVKKGFQCALHRFVGLRKEGLLSYCG